MAIYGQNEVDPHILTISDNNVAHRNVKVNYTAQMMSFSERFFVRNPKHDRARAQLKLEAPRGWKVKLNRLSFGRPFTLAPGQEILVTMDVKIPTRGATGEVTVVQETQIGTHTFEGGMVYQFQKGSQPAGGEPL